MKRKKVHISMTDSEETTLNGMDKPINSQINKSPGLRAQSIRLLP